MTLFNAIQGSREKPKGVKLTTTDATPILVGPASGFLTLETLRFSSGGSGANLSLYVTDGTTNWYLLNTVAVTANSNNPPIEDHIVLRSGWSIVAQASGANQIDIVAVYVLSGQSGTTPQ